MTYREVVEELNPLLVDYADSRNTAQPFWRLQRDEVWEVQGASSLPTTSSGDVLVSVLTDDRAGDFPPDYADLVCKDRNVRQQAVDIVASYLPSQMRHEVLNRLGLSTTEQSGRPAPVLPAEAHDSAANILRRLLGISLKTVTGHRNVIVAVSPPHVVVSTERSPQGQPVPIADLEHALSLLRHDGSVTITPKVIGHRSSFLGAVLLTLPGSQVAGSPPQLTIGQTQHVSQTAAGTQVTFEGDLTRERTVEERGEQASLRGILFGSSDTASCALCGQSYPVRFLWAAHIKKRSLCTDTERRDLSHVAMAACVFGCDVLFETGFISVSEDGLIVGASSSNDTVGRHIQTLRNRRCHAHSPGSEPYFRWHRDNVFRQSGMDHQ